MHREADIGKFLPEYVREYREIEAIVNAENPELTALWSETERTANDLYFNTLTEEECTQWEKDLKLSVGATDTVEERRFRIKAKSSEERPYSFRGVKQILDNLCGVGNYTLLFNGFTVIVRLELTVKKMYNEVLKTLDRVIPLNMILDIDLRYNQYSLLTRYTHKELQAFTHEQLRNEVI